MDSQQRVGEFRKNYEAIRAEVAKVMVGLEEAIEQVLCCLLTGGHALLEGVPGIGKTMLIRTLSEALDLRFSRIQFTPDLMPADIIGTNIVVDDGRGGREFRFQQGPIFGNLILADEINRATPKTQSAVLEAMAEQSVSVAKTIHRLEAPFFVLATQNPLEMEGTYPLPEAQLDRFMFKVLVGSPSLSELTTILDRTTGAETPVAGNVIGRRELLAMGDLAREVPVASHVKEYIGRIILATHPGSEFETESTHKYIRYGASPRAAQSIILAAKINALRQGRYNVAFSDIRRAAAPALRHRLILNFEGEAEGVSPDDLVDQVLTAVPEALTV
ncbi:MAG: AAA domain-containing protein [Anaerolineaceae bacterium]|nr:AAA domain-containing protein [Anaerolineaceae bacterium]